MGMSLDLENFVSRMNRTFRSRRRLANAIEQPTNDTDQVVETPRSRTWSAQEECVEGRWGDLGEGHDPCGVQIAIKHPQHLVLDIVPAVQGTLVADKSDDMWGRR